MTEEDRARKINSIACLWELKGYEDQAKKRGISPEELKALHDRTTQLTPKKRGSRR